jgi:hypothetical protein
LKLKKWGAPLVQGGDYQKKEPEIRREALSSIAIHPTAGSVFPFVLVFHCYT